MATKKAATKKPVKAAAPAKKAPAKIARPANGGKTAAKKSVKPAPKKAAVKKPAAPVKKSAPKKVAPAPKKAVVAKKPVAAPKKAEKQSKPILKKIVDVAKKAIAAVTKTPEPVKKKIHETPEPVKKGAVATKVTKEAPKAEIKPVAKPAPKKEPAKPVVIPKTSTTKKVKYEPEFTKSVLDLKKQQQESNAPTMRYSDAELSEFRDLINRKLDTAKKELAYLQGLITRKDESGDMEDGRYMTMEDGSMSMEREQLSQMASRQIQFIDHLEKAIMRIENKTYGICRVTGKLIDKARLRAVPHATLSIEAKSLMNK